MEVSDILLLFFGSMIAMLAIISSKALMRGQQKAIRVQIKNEISREELQKKKIDALYGRRI